MCHCSKAKLLFQFTVGVLVRNVYIARTFKLTLCFIPRLRISISIRIAYAYKKIEQVK